MTRAPLVVALALVLTLGSSHPVDARPQSGYAPGGRGFQGRPDHDRREPRGSFHRRPHHQPPRQHHGWHHHGRGPSVYFYGSFGPYWFPYPRAYYYPYYSYYPYYPAYPYPPHWDDYAVADEGPSEREEPPPEADLASYGLVQLIGVPDGAAVELDGRFWLSARQLDDRWLALPEGEHQLSVTVGEERPIVRSVRVVPGKTHVLKFGPPAERRT